MVASVVAYSLGGNGSNGRCVTEIAGEKNTANAIITEALVRLRKNQTDEAYTLLETALDVNVVWVGEKLPLAESTTNVLSLVRKYRRGYPQYRESLRHHADTTLKNRNDRANFNLTTARPTPFSRSAFFTSADNGMYRTPPNRVNLRFPVLLKSTAS